MLVFYEFSLLNFTVLFYLDAAKLGDLKPNTSFKTKMRTMFLQDRLRLLDSSQNNLVQDH